jgi:DUF1016 N-terminal domain
LTYPQIVEALSPEKRESLAPLMLKRFGPIRESLPPESVRSGDELTTRLSFSHFVELLAIEDPFKRSFYEAECIRGNWGVRELKRQIASLYFERSALSRDKANLNKADTNAPEERADEFKAWASERRGIAPSNPRTVRFRNRARKIREEEVVSPPIAEACAEIDELLEAVKAGESLESFGTIRTRRLE